MRVYACVYRVYGHARGICLDNPVCLSVSCFKWMFECSCVCVSLSVCVCVCVWWEGQAVSLSQQVEMMESRGGERYE